MKIRISPFQLLSLMVLVPIGTASFFYLAPELKQDSWIALLIYMVGGIVLQLIYTALYYKYPYDTIVTYMPKIFGKFAGSLIGIIYILYFTYLASRVLRDITELILIDVMPEMYMSVISGIIIITVAYGVYCGFEVLARGAQVGFVLLFMAITLQWLLLFATPHAVDITNLKPILENRIWDVVKKGWHLITFPYGETIVFTMLFSSINEPSRVRKTAFLAMVLNGITLVAITIMFISVLDVDYSEVSLFPLLDTLRVVKLKSFINRFDLMVIIFVLYVPLFKIAVFMYAAMLGTFQMLKIRNINNLKYLSIPFAIIIFISSFLIAKNYSQHIQISLGFTVKYIHVPLQIILPSLALIVYFIRNTMKNN